MNTQVYQGTAFRQALDQSAPWMFSFVAPAEALLVWAGIPQRSDNDLVGFQRLEEQARVEKAKNFFSQFGHNQSPTSIVMGIHTTPEDAPIATLKLGDALLGSDAIRSATLTISYDPDESLDTSVKRLRAQITARIAVEGPPSEDENAEADSVDVDEVASSDLLFPAGSAEEGGSPDADGVGDLGSGGVIEGEVELGGEEELEAIGGDKEIELGKSLLSKLLERLEDSQWCQDHEADIRDLAKPASIIDGQHRIQGARLCERALPLSVIAIHNCSWAEQVFQFTVVNYTATGIPDQFITANAALSLTSGELSSLEDRLQQAGVKVVEYELMTIINFDDESPFRDLINLSPKKSAIKIGYKTMIQVGKGWYSGKENAVRQVIANIYPGITGKKHVAASLRLQHWKDSEWGLFFKDFWSTVAEHFKDDTYLDDTTGSSMPLWSVGSNLMIAIVLQVLQEEFFKNLAAQDDEFFQVSKDGEQALAEMRIKIRKRAKTFISYFKPDFFAREWKTKSLNTGAGKDALRACLREIVDSKGSYQYGKSQLITGKIVSGA